MASYPAHLATKYAETQGKGNAFHDAVMKAYWQEAGAIDDKQLLQRIAAQVGLRSEDLAAAWENIALAEAVKADVEQAGRYGLAGVPALIFAEKYQVSGAQPYHMFKQIIARLQKTEPSAEK